MNQDAQMLHSVASNGFEASSQEPSSPLWTTDGSFGYSTEKKRKGSVLLLVLSENGKNCAKLRKSDAFLFWKVLDNVVFKTLDSFLATMHIPDRRLGWIQSNKLRFRDVSILWVPLLCATVEVRESFVVWADHCVIEKFLDYGLLHIHRGSLINPQGIISIHQSEHGYLICCWMARSKVWRAGVIQQQHFYDSSPSRFEACVGGVASGGRGDIERFFGVESFWMPVYVIWICLDPKYGFSFYVSPHKKPFFGRLQNLSCHPWFCCSLEVPSRTSRWTNSPCFNPNPVTIPVISCSHIQAIGGLSFRLLANKNPCPSGRACQATS